MTKKAKSVTKAWALKDKKHGGFRYAPTAPRRVLTCSSRRTARILKDADETVVRVRVTVEELSP